MRVAVVGTGFISTLVAPKIVRWGYTVTDVVSTPRSLTKAQELAGPLGARASCDYDAVLAREDVDAVYLGIPNDLHHDYATRALRAGKHVILEKPMAANSAQAQEILDLARERGLLLFDATTTFYLPTTRRVAEWLPLVGDVKLAVANYSQYSSRYDRFKRGDVAPAFDPAHAGGALMDLGHYCVSWLCRMFGEPRGVTYAANVERGSRQRTATRPATRSCRAVRATSAWTASPTAWARWSSACTTAPSRRTCRPSRTSTRASSRRCARLPRVATRASRSAGAWRSSALW